MRKNLVLISLMVIIMITGIVGVIVLGHYINGTILYLISLVLGCISGYFMEKLRVKLKW